MGVSISLMRLITSLVMVKWAIGRLPAVTRPTVLRLIAPGATRPPLGFGLSDRLGGVDQLLLGGELHLQLVALGP